jgi:hypothetical protein
MGTVFTKQIQEASGIKCLGAAYTGTHPAARVQKFNGNNWTDCRLPKNSLRTPIAHSEFVIGNVIQVHLTRLSIERSPHPRSGTSFAMHEMSKFGRVWQ